MEFRINTINDRFLEEKVVISGLKSSISDLEKRKVSSEERLNYAEEALTFLQVVAKDTLKNLEYHISNVVTMALNSVDPEFPSFISEVEIKRGRPEWHMYFDINGEKAHPLESSGGGAVNIAAFALRIVFLLLELAYGKGLPVRLTLILDEPFRDVSPDRQMAVSNMVQKLSTKLGIQIIMISHADDINAEADLAYLVERKKGISTIKQIE